MATQGGPDRPPGTGVYRPGEILRGEDHARGWSLALDDALDNIGRASGLWTVDVEFSAVVDVRNPGNVIEYRVKLR